MSLKLDNERIRTRLRSTGGRPGRHGSARDWWEYFYSQDVRALRAAYNRERSMRRSLESVCLDLVRQIEHNAAETPFTVLQNIAVRLRLMLGIAATDPLPRRLVD